MIARIVLTDKNGTGSVPERKNGGILWKK